MGEGGGWRNRDRECVFERESEREVWADEQAGERKIWRWKESERRREKEREMGPAPSIF